MITSLGLYSSIPEAPAGNANGLYSLGAGIGLISTHAAPVAVTIQQLEALLGTGTSVLPALDGTGRSILKAISGVGTSALTALKGGVPRP